MGTIFSIQRFSLDDGDGIRTCVFMKGCPLRCVWCHNPESQSFSPELSYDAGACIGCGLCVPTCPGGCHTLLPESGHILNRDGCIQCGKCTSACPSAALETAGKDMRPEDVMAVVLRDRVFYGSRGGMTLSGGEPMSQIGFSLELLERARAERINTVIETGGFAPTGHFQKIAPLCDRFYFDCKADSGLHAALTGADDGLILENLDFLVRNGARVALRCPIVPGANLTEAFVEKLCGLARKYSGLERIQLMPYHAAGTAKPYRFGLAPQPVFVPPTQEALEEIRSRIRAAGSVPVR